MDIKEYKYFDRKFDSLEKSVIQIHQVLCGYEGEAGYLKKVDLIAQNEKKIENRLKELENRYKNRIETKKAIIAIIISMLGSGGIATTLILLFFK